jgi:hypothetical protein
MKIRLFCIVLLAVVAAPATAFAVEVAVADLVSDSAAHDVSVAGEITIEGEMIGDFQRRGDWVWVQVNGDPYVTDPLRMGGDTAGANVGVGVRIPAPTFDRLEVTSPGGYRVRGPIVRLTGAWRHHDEAQGGESYLDTTEAQLIESEIHLTDGIRWWPMVLGMALLAGSGLALVLVKLTGDERQ